MIAIATLGALDIDCLMTPMHVSILLTVVTMFSMSVVYSGVLDFTALICNWPILMCPGVEVLESNEQTFFQYMDSQAMSQALLSNEVIPEHIQAKMATVGRQEANEVLFDYLMFHCTKSSLLVVGKVTREMSEEMAKLGKDILLQLDQGMCLCCVCVCLSVCLSVCVCVCVCVCMT